MNDLKETRVIDKLPDMGIDWGVKTINAPKVWEYTKGEGVKVAIIDSGVDMNHPDLKDKIKGTVNIYDKSTRNVNDDFGHGTHIAGLIAGEKTGVAPNAELYIANSLNSQGRARTVDILDGVTYAINKNVDILCMSLGTKDKLPQILETRLAKAVYEKGIIVVCATGNNGIQNVAYPASYDFIIGVGGINQKLERADFSNYGFNMDIVAPAVNILSTWKDGKYAYMSGTSTASPLVAGGLALVKSYYRKQGVELNVKQIKDMISKLNEKKDRYIGYGLFDIAKLIGLEN